MTRIYSYTKQINAQMIDAFCVLQKGFTDQFVYYRKDSQPRMMGLGRCIALQSVEEVESVLEGSVSKHPILFSFNRFDAENPAPIDSLSGAFPHLRFMLPEIVLIEDAEGVYLQVNSLGPVYSGRVQRFERQACEAPRHTRVSVPYRVEPDSREEWNNAVEQALDAIHDGRVDKLVLSRRQKVVADSPFSSKDLLLNLLDGPARGTVFLYRYADVFFCGCTPELLVQKKGSAVESMCLAGTCPSSKNPEERKKFAEALMNDKKNRTEHNFVVDLVRQVLERTCYNVQVPETPTILTLANIQHLYTPATAHILEGVSLWTMIGNLHPTPAVSGTPVGEAQMLIRQIEGYNRGFFAGACGYIDTAGDGEFSVALRSGVFDGEIGWIYAGCGIVSESSASDEYDEIGMKLQTALSAFDGEAE